MIDMKTEKSRIAAFVFLALAIGITYFILYNSSKDAPSSSRSSGRIVDLFMRLAKAFGHSPARHTVVHIVRKTAHFAEFAAQAGCIGLFVIFFYKKIYDKLIYILFTGLFTACVDEFTQMFSYGRSAEVKDVFIDFSGTAAAAAVCIVIYLIYKKKLVR